MDKVMVALVGEQPIPNLLPIRYIQPASVIFVCTEQTQKIVARLEDLIHSNVDVIKCIVEPYDIDQIYREFYLLVEHQESGELVFNLTGGTKIMLMAAYQAALKKGSTFLYLQTEGKKSQLFYYKFNREGIPYLDQNVGLPSLISIDDYIRAHVGEYHLHYRANPFEDEIYNILSSEMNNENEELMQGIHIGGAVEIDLAIRCNNQVGICEIKSGKIAGTKEGIKQLNTAGGREYLGTYTKKFLIIDRILESPDLRDLAKEQKICLIELPGFSQSGKLTDEEKNKCLEIIRYELSCRG